MWDSWHSRTPTLSSHSSTPLTHLLTLHTGHRYQWWMLKFQLSLQFYSVLFRLFILIHLVSLSSDAHCTLTLTLYIDFIRSSYLCAKECVWRMFAVNRFTIRGDVPGSPVWHLPLFSKSMLIKKKKSLFPIKFNFEGGIYGRYIEKVRVFWLTLEGFVGSRSIIE